MILWFFHHSKSWHPLEIRIALLSGPDQRPSVVVAVCECRRVFWLLLQRHSFSSFFLFGDYPETGEGKQTKHWDDVNMSFLVPVKIPWEKKIKVQNSSMQYGIFFPWVIPLTWVDCSYHDGGRILKRDHCPPSAQWICTFTASTVLHQSYSLPSDASSCLQEKNYFSYTEDLFHLWNMVYNVSQSTEYY